MSCTKFQRPHLIPLGRSIAVARLQFGLTVPELAAEVGHQPSTIRQIERGACSWLNRVRKVAEHLGVPLPEDF